VSGALRRRLAGGAGLLGLAALGWWAAARWLWPSTVPAGLHAPHVQAARFFSRAFLDASASYERFPYIDALLAQIAVVAVLCVYALRGQRLMRESAAGPIGTGMLLGMLGFAVVWLAQLPFGLAGVWWERRHHVSHQGYAGWLIDSFFALGGRFLFICLALLVAMGLARAARGWWWLLATPAFGGLALLSAFLAIYLLPSVHPLRDRALLAQAAQLARAEGVPGTRVEVQNVSRFTTAPNAEAVGFGPTRRVVLWDTLLHGGFSRAEIGTVIAHELGHIAHRHTLKGVSWLALFLIPITALVALAVRGRGGMARAEAVPVALLAFVVLSLVLAPVRNVISRRMEAEADWSALNATRDPSADRALLRRLATTSHSDPSPPGWAYVLYDDHPTIVQRLAMVYAWERLRSPKSAAAMGRPATFRAAPAPAPRPRRALRPAPPA
jgi:STE24 endopeptidase